MFDAVTAVAWPINIHRVFVIIENRRVSTVADGMNITCRAFLSASTMFCFIVVVTSARGRPVEFGASRYGSKNHAVVEPRLPSA